MINNMADEITGATDPFVSGEPDSDYEPVEAGVGSDVRVVTPEYTLHARSFHDMPLAFVTDILMSPPPISTIKKIGLMKLALTPDSLTQIEVVSFNEAYDLMNAWISASNDKRRQREDTLGIDTSSVPIEGIW